VTPAVVGSSTISHPITPSARYAEYGRDMRPVGKEKKERLSLDGRRNERHDLNSGAVSELDSVSRVRCQPASVPHSLTLILTGMYNEVSHYGTSTPVQ